MTRSPLAAQSIGVAMMRLSERRPDMSDYTFFRLHQQHEAQLTRDLEHLRIAKERRLEDAAGLPPRGSMFRRLAARLRASLGVPYPVRPRVTRHAPQHADGV